jgi:hypothetical protein
MGTKREVLPSEGRQERESEVLLQGDQEISIREI